MGEGRSQEVGKFAFLLCNVRTVGEPSDWRRTGGMENLEETVRRIIP